MRARSVAPRPDGDFGVYAPLVVERQDGEPRVDLGTRLVLWALILAFFGLVYLGLESIPL